MDKDKLMRFGMDGMPTDKYIYLGGRSRTVENKEKEIKVTNDEFVGCMCPICLNITPIHIFNTYKTIGVDNFIKGLQINTEYHGTCSYCNEDVKFDIIDGNMIEIIRILNEKGYFTLYCCEGHIEPNNEGKEEFTLPYIYFALYKDAEILKEHPLPATWELSEDINLNIFTVYDSINSEAEKNCNNKREYIDYIKSNWNQVERLNDILKWAKSLPDKPHAIKLKDNAYITTYKDTIIDYNAGVTIMYSNKQLLVKMEKEDEE